MEIIKSKPQAPTKFLVIGEPFAGKTTLASKAPKPLFLSTDGNAAKSGLDAVNVNSVDDIRETIEYMMNKNDYKTLVIDTIEGVVDMFIKQVIREFNDQGFRIEGKEVQALSDVPYGKATGILNKKVDAFSTALASLKQNVIILSYTKRRIDELSNAITLDSELKNIRFFTKFMDAQVICYSDGERHRVNLIEKRDGLVAEGEIVPFLAEIGWEMPKKSTKVGKVK